MNTTLAPSKSALAKSFLKTLETEVPTFLSQLVSKLQTDFQLDVSNLPADHVCWRTERLEEYNELVSALQEVPSTSNNPFQLLVEADIGGRPIATFGINTPIQSKNTFHQVNVIEIASPKEGSPYSTGLEHAEFLIGQDEEGDCQSPWNNDQHQRVLTNYVSQYPHLPWNLRAQNKKSNPDVSLKVHLSSFGQCSAKFHWMPLDKVIEAEKKNSTK